MNLIRYEPWSLHRELFQPFFAAREAAAWAPDVDIEETANQFVLTADLPGVDFKTVDITLENGVLHLSGQREASPAREGVQARRSERPEGRFERRFALPDTVDGAGIAASGKNGVLEVLIPKRAQAQARKISIQH